jgi:hypothetical protein
MYFWRFLTIFALQPSHIVDKDIVVIPHGHIALIGNVKHPLAPTKSDSRKLRRIRLPEWWNQG